ncbi:MAG: xanthine dehydrogenase accessory factor [Gaiellales bacterium]|nr:xanthine dehydrogenase accessory factor [Gaiellales bacterium]
MRDVLSDARDLIDRGEPVAVAMVVDTKRSAPRPLGSRLLVTASGEMRGSVSGGCVESDVVLRAQEVLENGVPQLVPYGITDDDAFDVGLPCGGEIEVFIAPIDADEVARVERAVGEQERLSVTTVLSGPEAGRKTYGSGEAHSAATREAPDTFVELYAPPPVLMVFGAVDTAQALCRMAKQVGFRTIVSDARTKFARPERLPDADEIVVGWPAMAYDMHPPDEATYVVVLTHDARFDEPALGPAVRSSAPYVGALGSRRAQDRRRERMLNAGYSENELARISGPLGLDIGAVTPAETAVSILAEVMAVRSGRDGGRLSQSPGRIHSETVAS